MDYNVLITAIVTIVCSLLASAGFWGVIAKKIDKKDAKYNMLLGLGHDRIMELGMKYITRGWLTRDEYENLYDYLFKPYEAMGGNGAAKRIIQEVNRLEIREYSFEGKEVRKKPSNEVF